MEELDVLLGLSGHADANGPRISESVLTVLDTDIATWTIGKLREAHKYHEIHIVPANPTKPRPFDSDTCEALGINMDQLRQVHCKSFACSQSMASTDSLSHR